MVRRAANGKDEPTSSDGAAAAPRSGVRELESAIPRVLIVDDEKPLTTALRRAFVRDAEVEVCNSGDEAVALLANDDHFDVVLCDIMMPGMTGIDVYQRVRAVNSALASRIVFMTGGALTAATREFLDQCSNPRFEKPFDLKRVRRIIRERAAASFGRV